MGVGRGRIQKSDRSRPAGDVVRKGSDQQSEKSWRKERTAIKVRGRHGLNDRKLRGSFYGPISHHTGEKKLSEDKGNRYQQIVKRRNNVVLERCGLFQNDREGQSSRTMTYETTEGEEMKRLDTAGQARFVWDLGERERTMEKRETAKFRRHLPWELWYEGRNQSGMGGGRVSGKEGVGTYRGKGVSRGMPLDDRFYLILVSYSVFAVCPGRGKSTREVERLDRRARDQHRGLSTGAISNSFGEKELKRKRLGRGGGKVRLWESIQ